MFNILGKRYLFFGISLLLILPGIVLAIFTGLNLSVDFTGGTLIELQFVSGSIPPLEEIVGYTTSLMSVMSRCRQPVITPSSPGRHFLKTAHGQISWLELSSALAIR